MISNNKDCNTIPFTQGLYTKRFVNGKAPRLYA